jgi:hypothetical protein
MPLFLAPEGERYDQRTRFGRPLLRRSLEKPISRSTWSRLDRPDGHAGFAELVERDASHRRLSAGL